MSTRALKLLLFGAFAVLCLHGLVWDSPAVDEFTHLPVGYFYLKTGDFDLAARTPPLIKELAALPLLPPPPPPPAQGARGPPAPAARPRDPRGPARPRERLVPLDPGHRLHAAEPAGL